MLSIIIIIDKLTAVSSELELRTTIPAPKTAKNTPRRSLFRNTSFNIRGANMTFVTSVVVPNGAMVEAGANPYAIHIA